MNDWQRVYSMTETVTPAALLTVTRLRLALALGTVSEDQVTAALAAGADDIGELLESADGGEVFEELTESFDPFGRMV